jgi:hypothetical protein
VVVASINKAADLAIHVCNKVRVGTAALGEAADRDAFLCDLVVLDEHELVDRKSVELARLRSYEFLSLRDKRRAIETTKV